MWSLGKREVEGGGGDVRLLFYLIPLFPPSKNPYNREFIPNFPLCLQGFDLFFENHEHKFKTVENERL